MPPLSTSSCSGTATIDRTMSVWRVNFFTMMRFLMSHMEMTVLLPHVYSLLPSQHKPFWLVRLKPEPTNRNLSAASQKVRLKSLLHTASSLCSGMYTPLCTMGFTSAGGIVISLTNSSLGV